MPKKNKKMKKQKGGNKVNNNNIDLNRKNDTNYDWLIQCISIGLLIIALFLGIKVYLDRNKPRERIVYKEKPQVVEKIIEKPVYINDNNFYEEKIERRLEPPGVVYEPERYVPINIRTSIII